MRRTALTLVNLKWLTDYMILALPWDERERRQIIGGSDGPAFKDLWFATHCNFSLSRQSLFQHIEDTLEPACKVHGCKVFSDVRSIFGCSQSKSAIVGSNPVARSARLYGQSYLDKTLTLQASATVLSLGPLYVVIGPEPRVITFPVRKPTSSLGRGSARENWNNKFWSAKICNLVTLGTLISKSEFGCVLIALWNPHKVLHPEEQPPQAPPDPRRGWGGNRSDQVLLPPLPQDVWEHLALPGTDSSGIHIILRIRILQRWCSNLFCQKCPVFMNYIGFSRCRLSIL